MRDLDDTWLNPFDDPLGSVVLNVDDYAFQVRQSQSNSKQNHTDALKQVQMFLSHPIGGAIRVTPLLD